MLLLKSDAFLLSPDPLAALQGLTGKAMRANASHPGVAEKSARKARKVMAKTQKHNRQKKLQRNLHTFRFARKARKVFAIKTVKHNKLKDLNSKLAKNTICEKSEKSRMVLNKICEKSEKRVAQNIETYHAKEVTTKFTCFSVCEKSEKSIYDKNN
jgi:hypothetical protein